jgi:glycosyltransferase involved in cell wall biosynthesis
VSATHLWPVDRPIDMIRPLVTVIVPCFNAERTLERTLASVAAQTHRFIEIIIVDDGSTDTSAQIAAKFASEDSRATLICQDNKGVAAARNIAIDRATGDFIAPIDADDLWNKRKLEKSLRKISANLECGLVYNWFENIDSDDQVFFGGFRHSYTGNVLPHLCRLDFIGNGSSVLMRTSAVRSVGGYNSSLRARGAEGCEDWQLALRIAEHHYFDVVPEPLTGYRHSPGNMSSRMRQMIRSAEFVAAEASLRHSELADEIRAHLLDRNYSYLLRCARERRWDDVVFFLRRLGAYGGAASCAPLIRSLGDSIKELPRQSRSYFLAQGPLLRGRRRRRFE